jgi:hypothetical protein
MSQLRPFAATAENDAPTTQRCSGQTTREEDHEQIEPAPGQHGARARRKVDALSPLPCAFGCQTGRRGHNFLRGSWFGSARCVATGSAALRFFCAPWPVLSIELPKDDVRDAVFSAARRANWRVKNMRRLHV